MSKRAHLHHAIFNPPLPNCREVVRLGVLLLAFLGIAYEHVAAWRDNHVLTQVGRSVDVGGRTLNIHCLGEGVPAVIFESGRTSPGYVWMPSQRGVSTFTSACWYDRAGLGWSDPGPDPNWGDSAVRDLHTLLMNAGVQPPFVLVGASFGGYIIRLYHHAYPGEVSGMVFVDAAHEDAGTIERMPHRNRLNVPRSVIRGLSRVLGQMGMMRLVARAPGPTPKDWSPDEWDVLARLRRQRGALLADAQEGPEHETAKLARSTGGLEQLPLIVLTQGRTPENADSVEDARNLAVLRGWIELQRRLAQRSSRGRHVVVANSGHGIAVEAPDAVISAVREIVEEVRPDR